MEQSYWARFAHFVKESYTERIKQSASGLFMGLISANNLLFAGFMAHLVGPVWWFLKGIGAVALAFSTSLATSYVAYLEEQYKEKKSESKAGKRKKAA